MWILDAAAERGGIRFWGRGGESKRVAYTPSFLFTLDDPHLHRDLLDGLDERFGLAPCRVQTIFSEEEGYSIAASRKVAGLIEEQSGYSAKIYNLDLRPEQRFLAEKGLTACSLPGEDRFATSFDRSLAGMEISVADPPYRSRVVSRMAVDGKTITGSLPEMLQELATALDDRNPDLILFPHADYWMPLLVSSSEEHGILLPFSRTGRYSRLSARSYWSYGRMVHREGALIPEGRCLIDSSRSFTYRESGIAGVLLASRMTGLAPNLTARLTPGTLISAYENYEAIRRGIAVPFRKWDPEESRPIARLREADKGGMIFQPHPGVYDDVVQVDFTSMYPSIIVGRNLSPETVGGGGEAGFPRFSACAGCRAQAEDESPEEGGETVCGYGQPPEMDAGHQFWLYGLPEREVRVYCSARGDHPACPRDPDCGKRVRRGVRMPCPPRDRRLALGCGW